MENETLQEAIETYGENMQLLVAIEELSELIKAIVKTQRDFNKETVRNVFEEMADVKIMLAQLEIIYGAHFKQLNLGGKEYRTLEAYMDAFIDYKIERLRERTERCNNER